MAKVTIGGVEYHCPEMNFLAVEVAWPHVARTMITQDPIQAVGAGVHVVAACLQEQEEFDPKQFGFNDEQIENLPKMSRQDINDLVAHFLKKKMKAGEIPNIRGAVEQIIEEAGLLPDQGEGEKSESEDPTSPGTETAPSSSVISSPPESREVAGTE